MAAIFLKPDLAMWFFKISVAAIPLCYAVKHTNAAKVIFILYAIALTAQAIFGKKKSAH